MLVQEIHQGSIVEIASLLLRSRLFRVKVKLLQFLLLRNHLLDDLLDDLLHRLLHRSFFNRLLFRVKVEVLFRLFLGSSLLDDLLDDLLDGFLHRRFFLFSSPLLLRSLLLFRSLFSRGRVVHHQVIQIILQVIHVGFFVVIVQSQEVIVLLLDGLLRRSLLDNLLNNLLNYLLLRSFASTLRSLLDNLLHGLRRIIHLLHIIEIVGVSVLLLKRIHHLRFLDLFASFLGMRAVALSYAQFRHHLLSHVRGTSADLLSRPNP